MVARGGCSQDVDGRAKPGHDEKMQMPAPMCDSPALWEGVPPRRHRPRASICRLFSAEVAEVAEYAEPHGALRAQNPLRPPRNLCDLRAEFERSSKHGGS